MNIVKELFSVSSKNNCTANLLFWVSEVLFGKPQIIQILPCLHTRWNCISKRHRHRMGAVILRPHPIWQLVPFAGRDGGHSNQRKSLISKCEEQPQTSRLYLSSSSGRIFSLVYKKFLTPAYMYVYVCVCVCTCIWHVHIHGHMLVWGEKQAQYWTVGKRIPLWTSL